jgi:hypothetical protein
MYGILFVDYGWLVLFCHWMCTTIVEVFAQWVSRLLVGDAAEAYTHTQGLATPTRDTCCVLAGE